MKSTEFINEAFTNPYPLKNLNSNVVFDISNTRQGSGAQAEWTTVNGVKYQAHAFKIGLTKAQRDKRKAVRKAKQEKIDQGIRPKRTIPRLGGVARSKGGIWEVHFESIKIYNTALIKGEERSSEITGTGDAFRVFATMFEFIKYIVKQANPDILSIKSKSVEPSRVKLYDTHTRRYASTLGYEVVKSVTGSDLTRIELRKVDMKTEEFIKEELHQHDTILQNLLKMVIAINKHPERKANSMSINQFLYNAGVTQNWDVRTHDHPLSQPMRKKVQVFIDALTHNNRDVTISKTDIKDLAGILYQWEEAVKDAPRKGFQ